MLMIIIGVDKIYHSKNYNTKLYVSSVLNYQRKEISFLPGMITPKCQGLEENNFVSKFSKKETWR